MSELVEPLAPTWADQERWNEGLKQAEAKRLAAAKLAAMLPPWDELANAHVAALETEAKASPKDFYGNANHPADGHERVRSALRVVNGFKQRLENLVRGK